MASDPKRRKPRLTARKVEALRPHAKQYEVRDGEVTGLLLRVQPSGAKRWGFRARQEGRQRYIPLGGFPDLSLEAARRRAREVRVRLDKGERPADERTQRRQAPTLGELWSEYEVREVAKKAPSSQRNDKSRWKRHLKHLASRKAVDVSKSEVGRLLSRIASACGPFEANRTLALVRRLYGWALTEGLIDGENPAASAKPRREQPRQFSLDAAARKRLVSAIVQATDDPLWQGYFLLLLLTGCRRTELLSARWEWVHLDYTPPVIALPAAHTKQGQEHYVTLSSLAVQIVEQLPSRDASTWLFPSETARTGHRVEPKAVWDKIRTRAGLPEMRVHDLRHAVGSALGDAGTSAYVIQKALGHQQAATTSRYVHPHLAPVHTALEQHGASIASVLEGDR